MSTKKRIAPHDRQRRAPPFIGGVHSRMLDRRLERRLNRWGLRDELLRLLLMVAAHEFLSCKADVRLREKDLFEFACRILWWLDLVRVGRGEPWVHKRRLDRLMGGSARLTIEDMRHFQWSDGVSSEQMWKMIREHFRDDLYIQPVIHHKKGGTARSELLCRSTINLRDAPAHSSMY